MSIIHLPDLVRFRRLPLITLLDVQQEFIATGRARYIGAAEGRLDSIRSLLLTSRTLGLPIAHFRRVEDGHFFNEASQFGGWIEGFAPRPNEFNYVHSKPSCFSNESFRRMLEGVTQPTLVIAGFSAEESCLSTVIDAYSSGYETIFLEDCSATAKLGDFNAELSYRAVCSIIGRYARIADRQTLFQEIGGADAAAENAEATNG